MIDTRPIRPWREKALLFERHLGTAEKAIMVVLVFALTTVTFLQVFSRYALRQSFFWTEELARFLFIYICMLGIAMGIASRGHYGLDAFYKLFPARVKAALVVFGYVVIAFFIVVFTWKGLEELPSTAHQFSVSLPVTMIWSYAALPLGGILMIIHHVLRIIIDAPLNGNHGSDTR
jgi:TRAP-type C4-dicarboxylate transport system permease small subunit